MTAIDHSQGQARIVRELTDRVSLFTPALSGPLYLGDFLALSDSLKAAGYSTGTEVERIEAINAAIEEMLNTRSNPSLSDIDLMTADPGEVAERIRQAGIDRAANLEMANVRNGFQFTLAKAAATHIRVDSDRIIREMRKRFDPAVKVVKTAADRGLTEHTDMASLLNLAAPDVIAAYRGLGPAVAELDAIAGLRNQLTTVAKVGPIDHPMAAFITDVSTELELEGAANIWTGQVETVQHNLPLTGTHLANVRRKRLGGAWLALVCAGYKLRLNTGAEAVTVVDRADA